MQSFDHSLKHLLQQEPADFIGFGLGGGASFRILEPTPSVLPSRGRDIDGAYVIAIGDVSEGAPVPDDRKRVVHIEFYRRHQSVKEIGTDIAEAQVRLFRREDKLVVSHLWDLYGDADAPVRERRKVVFGADGSAVVYHRINLRGMRWEQLLAEAPPALWALVALARDGAAVEAVEEARDRIEAHGTRSPGHRADHLTVLRFVAEAEGLPREIMRAVLTREKLMASGLYEEIFGDGKAEGKAQAVLAVLEARGIPVSAAVRKRVLGCADVAQLDVWVRRAAVAPTAADVVRAKSPARTPARGAERHAQKS